MDIIIKLSLIAAFVVILLKMYLNYKEDQEDIAAIHAINEEDQELIEWDSIKDKYQ